MVPATVLWQAAREFGATAKRQVTWSLRPPQGAHTLSAPGLADNMVICVERNLSAIICPF